MGGGPAGVMLAYLLARRGISVTLLEAQANFDRDFRGDTLNPSIVEVLDDLGLSQGLFAIPHSRIDRLILHTPHGPVVASDYSRLKCRYPYLFSLRQSQFLDFLIEEAKKYPHFKLRLSTPASGLVVEEGKVVGVNFKGPDGAGTIRAGLTIAADGRFSRMRQFAGFKPKKVFPGVYDVLWFRLPRKPDEIAVRNWDTFFGRGYYICLADRKEYWQLAYQVPKGGFPSVRQAGIESFQKSITDLIPSFSDRIGSLSDWSHVRLLSAEVNHLPRWYRPGLLFLGDAAHTMSPVGGFGVNSAIQDAVVAANVLMDPLRTDRVETRHLATIQRRRKWLVLATQALQAAAHHQLIARALNPDKVYKVPFYMKIPAIRDLGSRWSAYGIWKVRVAPALVVSKQITNSPPIQGANLGAPNPA